MHSVTAVITGEVSATEMFTHRMVAALSDSDDSGKDLGQFARQHIIDVTQPRLIQLRRIVIAERSSFPSWPRAWYANGPNVPTPPSPTSSNSSPGEDF